MTKQPRTKSSKFKCIQTAQTASINIVEKQIKAKKIKNIHEVITQATFLQRQAHANSMEQHAILHDIKQDDAV